jgi:signal peptidase I
LPFSEWFEKPVYLTTPSHPKRGDVIVFKYPQDTSFNYIKRVVGIPGDRIQIIDKKVYVNDEQLDIEQIDGSVFMEDMDDKYAHKNFEFFRATLEERTYVYQIDPNNYYMSHTSLKVVPKDHFYEMGDNRDLSSDSRGWGYVPFHHIKGRAFMVWFSWSFPWPWQGPSETDETWKFRPWRIGDIIK